MSLSLFFQSSVSNAKVGFSKAMSAGWLRIDKSAPGGARVFRKTDIIHDTVCESLKQLAAGGELSDEQLKELKKRKLISNV